MKWVVRSLRGQWEQGIEGYGGGPRCKGLVAIIECALVIKIVVIGSLMQRNGGQASLFAFQRSGMGDW